MNGRECLTLFMCAMWLFVPWFGLMALDVNEYPWDMLLYCGIFFPGMFGIIYLMRPGKEE